MNYKYGIELEPTMMSDEVKVYGMTPLALDAMIKRSLYYSMGSLGMLAMSMMSDAQEAMGHGDTEEARQFLNRAKYVLSKYNIHVRPTTDINYDKVIST